MPKLKPFDGQTPPDAFQRALDALDVIGTWAWDAATDLVRADAFVALLFNVDPAEAEAGAPLAVFQAAIHADDRARILALIRRSVRACSAYVTEYRVISVDGRTRWVLARGRFTSDHAGRPLGGGGILVDITRMREEGAGAVATIAGSRLEQVAEHVLAAREAMADLPDPELRALTDALLTTVGHRLAQRDVAERRRRMN